MNKKNKNWKLKQLLLDLLFFLVLLALDQGTKYLAVTHLKDRSSVKIWPGVFELQYLENRGAGIRYFAGRQTVFCVCSDRDADSHCIYTGQNTERKKIQNLAYPADVYCSGRNRQYDRQTQTGLCG